MFQYPSSTNDGEMRDPLQIRYKSVKKVPELPKSFTNIFPVAMKGKVLPPKSGCPVSLDIERANLSLKNEFAWLENVCLTETMNDRVGITWSAHHASKKRGIAFEVSITSFLPLLREPASSVATIRHVMDKVKETITYLNLGQTPVLTANQPIDAAAKQIHLELASTVR